MMNYRPLFKKCFSALLGGIVLSTQALWAYQPETQFWSSRRDAAKKQAPVESKVKSLPERFPSPKFGSSSLPTVVRCAFSPAFLQDHITLLAALSPAHGTLRKVALPKNAADRGPVVIHIQDVHMNREAQQNIRETVFALGQSGAVDVVALEGASGEIKLQPFWNYPNPKAVAVTADYLLKKNKISGPIHAALSLGKAAISFVGIDDPAQYKANVQAYRTSAPRQEELRALLRRVQSNLAGKKQTLYSPALLALDRVVNDNRSEIIPLRDYVETLKSYVLSSEQKASPQAGLRDAFPHSWEKNFPEVCSFLKVAEVERSLELKKIEIERGELIDRLSHKLSSQAMDVLLAQSVAYRAGQVRSGDFYASLKDVCRKNGLRLADYPAMDAYVRYVLLTDEIDAEKLMIEISALEKSAYDRLAVSPAERALVAQSRRAWLTEKLVNFDLTRLEWEEYAGEKEKIDVGDVSSFESFYREADARDVSMANNLLTSLVARDKTRSPVGVLVTGGYHANGMANQLTRQGVTVISYVPKIGKVETGQGAAYLSTFSQEKTPLEKLFVGDRLFLAPVPDAGLAFEGTLMVPGLDVLDRGILPKEVEAFIKSTTGVDAKVTVERDGQEETGVTLTVVSEGQTHRVHVTSNPELEVVFSEPSPQSHFSIISRVFEYLGELFIRTKRGREVDPTIVVLPMGAEMKIAVPPKTFKADGSGILDFVRVPNYLAVNGIPVAWNEARQAWAENSGDLNAMVAQIGLLSNAQSVGLPTNNVGLNLGYMVYQNGKIYHKTGETDQASPHLWVVISQDGQARLQTIQFRAQGDEWVPQTINGQDFPQVKAAFRGPTLIQNGDVLIDPSEWEDLRHLFRLPVFDIPNFSGGMLTWGFADGTGQLLNDPVLRQQAFNGEVVALTLAPLTSYGVTSEERDRVFSEWGYIQRKNREDIKDRGEYFVDETHNKVFIKLLPGYHPHTVVGQNKQGQLVAVAVIGETNKTGATLQSLAKDLKRRGIVNAVVVGNGKDSRIYSGGKSTAVDGAYPTATALLSFFPPHSVAGTPQPIPDEDTIQKHLTRIQGELKNMEIEESKIREILNSVHDALATGKGFIRDDPVRLIVYGDPKTKKPMMGPLPQGVSVEHLVPKGDLDYVVAHNGGFWFGSVYVITRAPDGKFVMILRPWNPKAYHWTFPSGALMPGANARDTALHEIIDELSLPNASLSRLTLAGIASVPGVTEKRASQVAHVFVYDLSEDEYRQVIDFQKRTRNRRNELWDKNFLSELAEKTRSTEGEGEVLDVEVFAPDDLFDEIQSRQIPFVPEMLLFYQKGFLKGEIGIGRAAVLWFVKIFEKIGEMVGGQRGRALWGKAYKYFVSGGQTPAVDEAHPTVTAPLSFLSTHNVAGTPQPIPDEATIQKHLTRIQGELKNMEIEESKIREILNSVHDALATGKGFIRDDPVRLIVYGDPKTKKPLIGPLPPGTHVEDLVPMGDLDYVVVVYGNFWRSASYVVPFTPDNRIPLVRIAWGPYAGIWTVPSGGSMRGYTPEETAVSEVRDELGLSEGQDIQVEKIGTVPINPEANEGEGYQIAHIYKCQLTEQDLRDIQKYKKELADHKASLSEKDFLIWLRSQMEEREGKGEISEVRLLTPGDFYNSLASAPQFFAPEIVYFQQSGLQGFSNGNPEPELSVLDNSSAKKEGEGDSYEIHLPRIRNELVQSGLDQDKVEAIFNGTLDLLKKGKYFIRSDVQVRIAVLGLDGVPLVGPLPPGKTIDDLTPTGDFDYAVVHSAAFWFGSVFVVAQTPDQKVVALLRPRVPFAYHWTIPSGVLEPGRDIKESAADEVKEELGLESVDNDRLDPIFKVMMAGKEPNEINIIVSVFKYMMNDKEVQQVRENQRVLASIWESRGLIGLKDYLAEQEKEEGKGEALALQVLPPEELASKGKLMPEIGPILEGCFGIPDTRKGRATNLIWLKVFERVGRWWGGELGQRQWGKAYKDFAATIELSSAFAVMLVGLGGTLILAGSPLGGAVAPLLGAVFGWRFYQGHFLRPGESVPVTSVKVSLSKAFTMAMIYGVLIAVTPFLLGFGPDSLAFFNPVLAESLWGLAAGLHLFFDRKPSARREGKSAAQDLIDQLSTIQGAFSILTPITAGRTNQILNSGPFTPDRVDQTLERLQNDSKFRSGFLEQVRTSVQDDQLSPLQMSLLSSLLAAKGEPLGVVHFLGTDPESELEKIEKYSSESVRITVVAPAQQSSSDWDKTESLKTLGVNVVRISPEVQGWTAPLLAELEKEMAPWLGSVPSTLLATVGNGVKMDPAEIDHLDHGSRLKVALANAVGLADTLDLFFRIIQAVQTSA